MASPSTGFGAVSEGSSADGSSAAKGDDELKLLLSELKATQKALVLPIFLSIVLALQTFTQVLNPLKPLGWYGGIHCVSVFLFTLWQDVPDLIQARQRSQYRTHAYLFLSSAGFAVCTACRGTDELLLTMVLVFLLPITSTWEVRDLDPTQRTPFHSYLALHFAMTCAQFREDFWGSGWKFCLVSLVIDIVLVSLVEDRARLKRQLLDSTCSTVRRLLTTVCDGCCFVSNAGEIILSDMRVADLVGGAAAIGLAQQALDGLPFKTLLSQEAASDKGLTLTEGSRMALLKSPDGAPLKVEICTVRCSMTLEAMSHVLGRKGHMPASTARTAYLCVIRQMASPQNPRDASASASGAPAGPGLSSSLSSGPPRLDSGTLEKLRLPSAVTRTPSSLSVERPRLEEGTLEKLRGGTLSSLSRGPKSQLGCNSEVGRCSQVGRFSEVGRCSQVSGFSNTSSNISTKHETASALTLANRRLQLMGHERAQGGSFMDRGTPMILEMDLPVSEVSSVVSEVQTTGPGTPSPVNVRMRMQSSRSNTTEPTACGEDGEELETTEVLSIGTPSDGHVRLQVAFRSQLLSQQRARLDSSEMELKTMRRDLHVRDEVQEEQKAVLKRFQKIVTREFSNEDEERTQNVTVFIFEGREEVRLELEELCMGLGYQCRVFPTAAAGTAALQQESGLLELTPAVAAAEHSPSAGTSASSGQQLRKPTWRSPGCTQLVLLGAGLLEQLRAEWRAAGIYVVLVSRAEELEDVGRWLGASGEAELKETLRALGVCEHAELPFDKSSILRFAQGSMRHRFGSDFLLVQHFGRGATGPVYGAKRLRDGEVFALKEVNLSKLQKVNRGKPGAKVVLSHEWKEVEILGSMQWPTVLNLIDTWTASGGKLAYLLMPALVGGTLCDQVDKAVEKSAGPLKGEQVAEWYAQALHGLSYLHWCGVFHRDIKTDNLLLDHNSRSLRIADFGSAVLMPGEGPHPIRRNCARVDVTTIRITSPEVFARRLFFPGSDLWSLAATFWEVIALQPLLPAEEQMPDVLLEIANALDELPERSAAAAAAGDVGSGGSGKLPAEIVAQHVKMLRQAQPISALASELTELLRRNPLRRPSAAALCSRPRPARDIRKALEGGQLWERSARTRHLAEFDRLLAESNAAADREPPEEANKAQAEADADTIPAAPAAAA